MTDATEAVRQNDVSALRPPVLRRTGRFVGLLMLGQLIFGIVTQFVLLLPVMADPPGFLAAMADSAMRVRVAALLWAVTGALSVGIAIAVWPLLRRLSPGMALWLLALAVVGLSVQVLEGVALLTMLSASLEYAQAGAHAQLLEGLGDVVRWWRNWTHYLQLLVGSGWVALLYAILYRFALVPRVLAAGLLVAIVIHIGGVVLPPLLGYDNVLPLVAAGALAHVTVALWLVTRGFAERPAVAAAGS